MIRRLLRAAAWLAFVPPAALGAAHVVLGSAIAGCALLAYCLLDDLSHRGEPEGWRP